MNKISITKNFAADINELKRQKPNAFGHTFPYYNKKFSQNNEKTETETFI